MKTAAQFFRQYCYEYRDQMIAGIICAGWDKREGGQVYSIPLGGMCVRQPFAIGGMYSVHVHVHVHVHSHVLVCMHFTFTGLCVCVCVHACVHVCTWASHQYSCYQHIHVSHSLQLRGYIYNVVYYSICHLHNAVCTYM